MRQFKSKQGSSVELHRDECPAVRSASQLFNFVLWSSRTKRLRQEEDARAQNTNNFNDNLNNKTIFSLNATNRAGRFFLCIDFFSPERFSLFARSVGDEKCGEEYFWLLRHATFSPARNLSKRETRDRRRGSFFTFPRIDFAFWKILLKSKSHFLPPLCIFVLCAPRNVWFPKPSSQTPTMHGY